MKTKLLYFRSFAIKSIACLIFFALTLGNTNSAHNNALDVDYCTSAGTFPWHEWIENIRISNSNDASEIYFNHTSFKEGYADFTDQMATLTVDIEYRLDVTTGYSWNTYDEYFTVWIDLNHDGLFDESEKVFTHSVSAPSTGTPNASDWDTFYIPSTANTGLTRMRIAMQRDEEVTDPCATFTYGEVEDYTIMIEAAEEPISCNGNITLTTQAEVDAFPACTIWEGDLSILDDGTDEITDLSNLSELEEVKGDFNLADTKISSLSNLENLKSVEGNLSLVRNTDLTSLNGLENLNLVWGFILLENGLIDNLDAINNLIINDGNDTGEFTIEKEPSLVNLIYPTVASSKMEFIRIVDNENLESIQIAENSLHLQKTSIQISNNNQLTSITGFPMLNSVEFLIVSENPLLPNLDAFTNLLAVDELAITDNTGLVNCCGIEPLLSSNNFAEVILEGNSEGCNSVEEILMNCELPICSGTLILRTQAEVDAFPNCTDWDGSIYINGFNITNPDDIITTLDALAGLKNISGGLSISNNTSLTNFSGLEDLETIGGHLYLFHNYQLSNISALSNLTSTGDGLHFTRNNNLLSLDGLDNLTTIGSGKLFITENGMSNLDPLSNIDRLDIVYLTKNPNLTNIEGLKNLEKTDLSIIYLSRNPQLLNLKGLAGVVNVEDHIVILNNDVLNDISALSSIESLGDYLQISNNNALTSLQGLQNLNSTGPIYVKNNNALSDCCALYPVLANDGVNGVIEIENNPSACNSVEEILETCGTPPVCSGDITLTTQAEVDAFGPCITYDGNITITGPDINDLTSLLGLQQVNGRLEIHNTEVTSLEGLDSLRNVRDWFQISANDQLVNLNPLSNLDSLSSFTLTSNPLISSLNGLQNAVITKNVEITFNLLLEDISALNILDSMFYIEIRSNPNLANLNALSNLETLESDLELVGNANSDVDFLSNLTFGGEIDIRNNLYLTNLDGLAALTSSRSLNIDGNPLLSNCCGITNYDDIYDIYVINNLLGCNSVEEIIETCSEPTDYCTSQSNRPWEEWIAGVTLENVNNPSGKCGSTCGYSDFTNLSADLVAGNSYPIALTEGKSWSGHQADLYWSVWIDWNGDGDFTDAGELMLELVGDDKTVLGNISIPVNAPAGTIRMRVAAKKGSFADPCETFEKGEVEDYTINISTSTAVVLDPNVENLYFTTYKNGREVILNWVTNIDSDYFEVERSKDNTDFTSIVKTNSLAQTAYSMLTYQEVDVSPMLGANYYRLKQVAEDGTVRYSESKLVEFDLDVNAIVLFPNPASTELFLNLKAFEGESADIQIFNQLGQPLLQKQLDEVEAETIRFDLGDYKSGVYFMTIKVAHQRLITKRFVVSRL